MRRLLAVAALSAIGLSVAQPLAAADTTTTTTTSPVFKGGTDQPTPTTVPATPNTLPFTGAPVWQESAIGGAMVLSGAGLLVIRRRKAARSTG